MNVMLESVLAVAVGCLTFLMALTCFSLRGFSRSRLEEISKQRGQLSRFGLILRHHEAVLFISELTLLALAWWQSGFCISNACHRNSKVVSSL